MENFTGSIQGAIIDQKSNSPIEYANIVVFNQWDSSRRTGAISD
jgi:hypothetical protein